MVVFYVVGSTAVVSRYSLLISFQSEVGKLRLCSDCRQTEILSQIRSVEMTVHTVTEQPEHPDYMVNQTFNLNSTYQISKNLISCGFWLFTLSTSIWIQSGYNLDTSTIGFKLAQADLNTA